MYKEMKGKNPFRDKIHFYAQNNNNLNKRTLNYNNHPFKTNKMIKKMNKTRYQINKTDSKMKNKMIKMMMMMMMMMNKVKKIRIPNQNKKIDIQRAHNF